MSRITRIDENTLELKDGRIVSYEATWKEETHYEDESVYENGELVRYESARIEREVDELTTDPQVSRLDMIEIEEWLNEENE